MTRWTAVVPARFGADSKSRLAGALSPADRDALAQAMAQHVLDVLHATPDIDEVVLLSPRRPAWWSGAWAMDEGHGLNDALARWRGALGPAPVLIVHGDLPDLTVADVVALQVSATATGISLASDSSGEGTNALAIADGRPFAFRFGEGSRRAHGADGVTTAVDRPGLAHDIDTPEDLAAWRKRCVGRDA